MEANVGLQDFEYKEADSPFKSEQSMESIGSLAEG